MDVELTVNNRRLYTDSAGENDYNDIKAMVIRGKGWSGTEVAEYLSAARIPRLEILRTHSYVKQDS